MQLKEIGADAKIALNPKMIKRDEISMNQCSSTLEFKFEISSIGLQYTLTQS